MKRFKQTHIIIINSDHLRNLFMSHQDYELISHPVYMNKIAFGTWVAGSGLFIYHSHIS